MKNEYWIIIYSILAGIFLGEVLYIISEVIK